MMTVTEKVAYLKGLVEGLDFDKNDKETKVINAVLDVLEDLALTVSDLDDEMALVTEQLDEVDEDLAELEDIFYDECDDCDCDCDCDDCCDCDEDMYEVECPNCGGIVDKNAFICVKCGCLLKEIPKERIVERVVREEVRREKKTSKIINILINTGLILAIIFFVILILNLAVERGIIG